MTSADETTQPDAADSSEVTSKDYGRGAALLSVGIGVTGIVTFAYFSVASHTLSTTKYGQISLLWSAVFLITPVFYRPIEQLLARTIAERRARDQQIGQALKIAALIQLGLGILFAMLALVFKSQLSNDLFDGNDTLFWVMFAAVLAYAVSYFARGILAGSQRFGLYGLLVFIEATSRILFPVAVAVGLATGENFVALGILAGPLASLFVVPLALLGRQRSARAATLDKRSPAEQAEAVAEEEARFDAAGAGAPREEADFTLSEGGGFAMAAFVIMACEQTILNAAPFLAKHSGGAAAAGAVVNLLVIARAPMQLFQSIATSILPHLSKLRTAGDFKTYRHSVLVTISAIAAFAGGAAAVMAVAGPFVMKVVFGHKYHYDRVELVAITLGMGVYLSAATLNQAALAAKRAATATICWVTAASFFVIWMALPIVDSPLRRVEIGYPASATLLFILLFALYRASTPRS